MKSDTERKRFYKAKNHQKTKRMHVHLSKELRGKLKKKKRSLLVCKGDKVRLMRGSSKGKTAKVARVSHAKMKVYLEGMSVRTARAREVMVAHQPSNLELVELTKTKERGELFSEAAFKKEEKKEKPKEQVKIEKPTVEAEVVPEEKPKAEAKPAAKTQDTKPETVKPAEKKPETKAPAAKPESPKPVTGKPETGNPKPETAPGAEKK